MFITCTRFCPKENSFRFNKESHHFDLALLTHICLSQMKAIYLDYFSYLMDENIMATKVAREFWNELDDMLPLGGSLQQDVPNWPWATKVVVCTGLHVVKAQFMPANIHYYFHLITGYKEVQFSSLPFSKALAKMY